MINFKSGAIFFNPTSRFEKIAKFDRSFMKIRGTTNRPTWPWGVRKVKAPGFLDNRHIKVVRFSALRTGRLYPQEYPGTHFESLRLPRAHGLVGCLGKNPQWHDRGSVRGPSANYRPINIGKAIVSYWPLQHYLHTLPEANFFHLKSHRTYINAHRWLILNQGSTNFLKF
jgi:hypothetical protein